MFLFCIFILLFNVNSIINKKNDAFDFININLYWLIPISFAFGIAGFINNYFGILKKIIDKSKSFDLGKKSNDREAFLLDQRNSLGNDKEFNKVVKLNSSNPGIVVRWNKKNNHFNWWTMEESHIKVLGTTGSFKSWFFILSNIYRNLNDPNLINRPNMVIIDPKGELYDNSVYMNKKNNNYNLVRLDLTNPKKSIKWNPLSQIWDLYHSKNIDEQNLAHNKIQDFFKSIPLLDESSSSDPIWPTGARNLLTGILLFMMEYHKCVDNEKFNKDYFNLINLYKLASDIKEFGNMIDTYATSIDEKGNLVFPTIFDIRSSIASILDAADGTKMSYQSNAVNAIAQLISSKTMWEILCKNEVDFHSMFGKTDKPTAFYITYPDDQPAIFPLVSIVVSQAYQAALEVARKNKMAGFGEKLDRTLQLFIDEFGILPKLPNFENWINIARSRNIAIVVAYQSEEQLNLQYQKERKVIEDGFRASLLLSTSSLETAKKYSDIIGQVDVSKESKSFDKKENKHTSSSVSIQKENIISATEIMNMDSTKYLLVMNNSKPSILNKSFVFKEVPKDELAPKSNNNPFNYDDSMTRRIRNNNQIYISDEIRRFVEENIVFDFRTKTQEVEKIRKEMHKQIREKQIANQAKEDKKSKQKEYFKNKNPNNNSNNQPLWKADLPTTKSNTKGPNIKNAAKVSLEQQIYDDEGGE